MVKPTNKINREQSAGKAVQAAVEDAEMRKRAEIIQFILNNKM